jgi:hypothetical protein
MDNQCELTCGKQKCRCLVESAYVRTDCDEHDYVEFFGDQIYLAIPIPPDDVPSDAPDDPEIPMDYSRLREKSFALARDMVGQRCYVTLPDGKACPVLSGTLTFTEVSMDDGAEPTWQGTLAMKVKSGKGPQSLTGRFSSSFLPAE